MLLPKSKQIQFCSHLVGVLHTHFLNTQLESTRNQTNTAECNQYFQSQFRRTRNLTNVSPDEPYFYFENH
jgi:hypothetical protein